MGVADSALETARLEILQMLEILDTAAEPAFDVLVRMASRICGCPISLMSLVDADRQWFKAQVGIDARETPRSQAFCAHAIRGDTLFEVPDATADARFAENPLVTGDPQIRFYAGQPILFDGVALGTLCVIDRVPRSLDANQREQLHSLSIVLADLLHGRMEAMLHRREAQRLSDFAQLSGDWLWESDILHRRTWFSGDATKAGGLFYDSMLGERFRDLAVLDWVGRPTTGPGLLGLLDCNQPFSNAIVEMPGAGERRFVSLTAIPMQGVRGEPIGFRGSAKDVTERIGAEVQAREREVVLRRITSQVPGCIYQFRLQPSGESSFPFVSEGARAVFELEPEDALEDAAVVFDRAHPDDLQMVRRSIAASLESGNRWDVCFRVVLPVGGVRWLQGTSMPEHQADGGTLWTGYIMDVTAARERDRELEEAYRALLASEQRIRAVIDNVPAMVSRFDRDERYTFANGVVGKVYGIDPEGLVGRSLREVCDRERYDIVKPHVDLALSGRHTTYEASGNVNGQAHFFQAVYVPDINADGEVIGFYAMSFDLTQRKNAELRQAESEKLLRGITDNLPALVCYVGADDRYRFVNKTYDAWLGLDHRAMVGRRYQDCFDAGTISALQPILQRAQRGERVDFERLIERDGSRRHLFVEYVPDIDAGGTVLGVFAMSTDITERRENEQRLIDSEKRLLDITNNLPAVIGQFDMDERCVFANDVGLREYDLTRADMPNLTFSSHLSEELYAMHAPAIQAVLAGQAGVVHGHRERDGRTRWFEAHLVPQVDHGGKQGGFYVMSFDVTSQKRANAERERSEARLRQITDALPVLVTYFDAAERMTYINETFHRWLGGTAAAIIGRTVLEAVGPELYAQRKPYIDRCLAGETVHFEIESLSHGSLRALQTTYLPDIGGDGRVVGVTTMSVDVTDMKAAERRLSQLAHRDALTGLPNRLSFNSQLDDALAKRSWMRGRLALMFLDVDHFKVVNDTYGHAVGDGVLIEFARRVRETVRPTDLVARLAGDEFVVVLRELTEACGAESAARQIIDCMALPFVIDGQTLQVTTSIGIAWCDDRIAGAAELLAKADDALYFAKESGRNTYRFKR